MLPSLRTMITKRPKFGALTEGRKGNHNWSFQPPTVLTKNVKLHSLRHAIVKDKYLDNINGYNFVVELETHINVKERMMTQEIGDEIKAQFEVPTRVGTMANWHLSFIERLRQNARMGIIGATEFFDKLVNLAQAHRPDINNLIIEIYQRTLELGDSSYEQCYKYFAKHKGSKSPMGKRYGDLLNKTVKEGDAKTKITGAGKKLWADIMSWTKREIPTMIRHLEKNEDLGMIESNPAHLIIALRNRPCEYEIIQSRNGSRFILQGTMGRSRAAGGIKGISQDEATVNKKNKHKIYEPIFKFAKLMLGLTKEQFHLIEFEGVKFYRNIKKIFPYDINNAEKIVGNVLTFLFMYNVDCSDPDHDTQWARTMYSGIGKTRLLNIIVLILILRILKDEFSLTIGEVYAGGDNFGLTEEINDDLMETEGLNELISIDDRLLGYDPKKQRFGGFHFTKDGATSMISLSHKAHGFYEYQPTVNVDSVLQLVIQYGWYSSNDCIKYFDYIIQNNIEIDELYSHKDLTKFFLNDEEQAIQLKDAFSDTLEWCKYNFPVTDHNTRLDVRTL